MVTVLAALDACATALWKTTTSDRVFLERYIQCIRAFERLYPHGTASWSHCMTVSDGQILTVLAQTQNPFVYHPEYNRIEAFRYLS